jgi:hypothetical protein
MEFRARLVHAEPQRRVVQVRAFAGERCLGSALGEAANAEEAEDRARERLRQRLRSSSGEPPGPPPSPVPFTGPAMAAESASIAPPLSIAPPVSMAPPPIEEGSETLDPSRIVPGDANEPREPPPDPEDWSADLAQLDRLLAALGWGRDQERVYVQRLFGHPSRSRLTRYADLMVLRRALEALTPGTPPDTAPLPLLRADLLAQCDDLLARLGWTTERARQCLEGEFGVTSRMRLSDEQLLAFNLLLESELLGAAGLDGADGCLESPSAHSRPSPS